MRQAKSQSEFAFSFLLELSLIYVRLLAYFSSSGLGYITIRHDTSTRHFTPAIKRLMGLPLAEKMKLILLEQDWEWYYLRIYYLLLEYIFQMCRK
jgi:hypothetical protein